MSNPAQPKTLAFFGATGDCAGFCLAHALNSGYTCTALARTPSKLTASLEAKNVSLETQSKQLKITQGDIRDVEVVKRVLTINGNLVDTIVSGIGGTMDQLYMKWNPLDPVGMRDATICQDATSTYLAAICALRSGLVSPMMPRLIIVSSTGLSPPKPNGGTCRRDVPLALVGLYHYLGSAPHGDKRVMESIVREDLDKPREKGGERAIREYCFVRASLLMDGKAKGVESVRVGVDDKPAVGYTITRADVGGWMFEKLVQGEWSMEWVNTGVTITY